MAGFVNHELASFRARRREVRWESVFPGDCVEGRMLSAYPEVGPADEARFDVGV